MNSNWVQTSLGELESKGEANIQTGPFGTVLKASEYSALGDPVISVGEIRYGYLQVSDQTPRISDEIKERLPQFVLKAGDIVFGRKGAIDRNSIVNENQNGWFLGSDGIRLRLAENIDSLFVSYQFRCPTIGKWLLQNSSGSVMPSLNQKTLNRLPLWLPNRKDQQLISKVLSALDKKIVLNNKINAELEAMAKLIYDYWFVQFDFPDANGNPYKSSGGRMVYNEALKREIPDGWGVGSLFDIANFANGIACQKYRPNGNEDYYKVIKIREMGSGFTDKSEVVSQNIPEKVVVRNGDVLFSWSATLDVKIWTGGIGGLNQHIFKVTSNKHPRTYYYFETLRYLQHFKMIAELRKTTMGHITQDHLKQSRISIPPDNLIEDLHQKIDPILNKVVKGMEENLKLASLRDWLLPMLMNGQVTVKTSKKKTNQK